jgi:hypothetical protein
VTYTTIIVAVDTAYIYSVGLEVYVSAADVTCLFLATAYSSKNKYTGIYYLKYVIKPKTIIEAVRSAMW